MNIDMKAPITVSALYHAADRNAVALSLSRYIFRRRCELGLSVTRAAELSGLAVSEWCSLEDGWVPEELRIIRSVAAALEVSWTDLDMLALFARCAQAEGRA